MYRLPACKFFCQSVGSVAKEQEGKTENLFGMAPVLHKPKNVASRGQTVFFFLWLVVFVPS